MRNGPASLRRRSPPARAASPAPIAASNKAAVPRRSVPAPARYRAAKGSCRFRRKLGAACCGGHGRIIPRQTLTGRGQPVHVARRAAWLRHGLPLRHQIALRLQADQQGIQRPRFDPCQPAKLIAMGPAIAARGKDREDIAGGR
eukprot:Opistho-2@87925